jgi:hypothetical protein
MHATYWKRGSTPDRYGKYNFDAPVEIDCRWEDGSDVYRDERGETVRFRSVAYVDRKMEIGDMLKEGSMESDPAADPTTDENAMPIVQFRSIPNLKCRETLYIAYL